MSTSWSSPDPRRVIPAGALARPDARAAPAGPSRGTDALAALVTVAVTLLAAAPVGLLWAALAPRAEAVLAGDRYLRADPSSDAYIAGDGYLSAAFLLAGVVTGLLAWRLARAHGPAVVAALAVGGLGAAYAAARVGEQVGVATLQQAVRSGAARVDITLELGAVAVLAVWPAAALLAYLAASLALGRASDGGADIVSSG